MLLREKLSIYCKKHMNCVRPMWQNAKFLNATADGTHSYQWVVNYYDNYHHIRTLQQKRVLTQNMKHADSIHTDCLKKVELTCSYARWKARNSLRGKRGQTSWSKELAVAFHQLTSNFHCYFLQSPTIKNKHIFIYFLTMLYHIQRMYISYE